MVFWGKEREILRMFLQKPFTSNTSINEADTPDPLTAVTQRLSMILGGEAQDYWNRILTVAHMVKFYTAYEAAVKVRLEEAKSG